MTVVRAVSGAGSAKRSSSSPMVGRARELAALDAVYGEAVAQRSPRLITIVGQEGVGKTRLVNAWLERLNAAGPSVVAPRLLHASVVAGGAAHMLYRHLLRSRFAVSDGDARAEALPSVEKQLAELFPSAGERDLKHFARRVLDVMLPESPPPGAAADESAPLVQDGIGRSVLRRLVQLDATRGPVIVVLDDLHNADDDSLGIVGELATTLSTLPLTIVMMTRPPLFERYPAWGAGLPHGRIELHPLTRAESEELLKHLLSRLDTIPQPLLDDACERAQGNPFFLEQLVRILISEGVIRRDEDDDRMGGGVRWRVDMSRVKKPTLPTTIAEVIKARIAALTADARDLLEKAAVFGNVFWRGAVVCLRRIERGAPTYESDAAESRAVDALLAQLVESEFFVAVPPGETTIPGELEFRFKHHLERHVVAKATPVARLRRYALVAAQWAETRLGAPTEEQSEFVAQLYETGGDKARAARMWFAAGDAARARYASGAAAEFYRRGIKLLDVDETLARLDALHNLGDVTQLAGHVREAVQIFEEMLRAAWRLDHRRKLGAVHVRLGRCHRTLGDLVDAERHFKRALELYEGQGDERGVAAAEDDLGRVLFLRGDAAAAEEHHRRALELRTRIGDARSTALSVHNLALVARALGRDAEAVARLDEALATRRQIGDRLGVVQSLLEVGLLWQERGESQRAITAYERGLDSAREVGDRISEAQLLARIGESHMSAWRAHEAAEVLEEAAKIADETGDRFVAVLAGRLLAEASLEQGALDVADAQSRLALEVAEAIGAPASLGLAFRTRARVLQRVSPTAREEADAAFRRAIEVFGEGAADAELAATWGEYGAFLASTGDAANAQVAAERGQALGRRADDSLNVDFDIELED